MKKSKFFSALFMCLFALGFTACDDDDKSSIINDGASDSNSTEQGGSSNNNSDETNFEFKIEKFYGEWECKESNILYSFPSEESTAIFITKNDDYNYKRDVCLYEVDEDAATLTTIFENEEGDDIKTFVITKANGNELVLKNEEEVSYTFKPFKDTINIKFPLITYIAVDLGLPSGLKWADRNVGAVDTTSYGNYFAWGEKNSKKEYTERGCLTYGKTFYTISGEASSDLTDSNDIIFEGNTYTKVYEIPTSEVYTFTFDEENNISDVNTNYIYDAARENCGEEWRTPTAEEFEELMTECTWEWTTIKNINGYKVTSKNNGNYIFLPAGGFYGNQKAIRHQGDYGYYNTSTIGDDTETFRNLRFWNYEPNMEWGARNYGRSVRAVAVN